MNRLFCLLLFCLALPAMAQEITLNLAGAVDPSDTDTNKVEASLAYVSQPFIQIGDVDFKLLLAGVFESFYDQELRERTGNGQVDDKRVVKAGLVMPFNLTLTFEREKLVQKSVWPEQEFETDLIKLSWTKTWKLGK